VYLLTSPTGEPVSTADALLAARLSATGEPLEPMLAGLIAAARQIAEQETGRKFMQQTWRIEGESWPAADCPLRVHRATAAAIAYWTGSTWATLATNAYAVYVLGNWTGVAPALGTDWPALGEVAGGPRIRIDLTAGAASAADVPECVKLFIKALVAHWINSPEAATARSMERAPFLGALLDPVRLWGD